MSKNLILYYSRTGENYVNGSIQKLSKGNTAYVATYIQEAIGGDLFPIETVDAYPNDYMACIDQAKKEMNAHARPALVHYIDDISDYDNIFICGPCWWGLFPMPIYSQLERLDFTNKNVYVVVTHEGSGMGNCERDLKNGLKGATFGPGLAIHGADAPKSANQVKTWAKSL